MTKHDLQNALIAQAASHWDDVATAESDGLILHWWENAVLREMVDAAFGEATGCLSTGEYIRKVTGQQKLGLGISVGCGSAEDEISLLEEGILERLIICDVSNEQLNRAEAFAETRGIDKRRLIRRNSIDIESPLPEKVDLFYWRHSLHHMLDTERAILWSRDNLSDNGAIYINDACPPNYMQWDDEVLHWTELYRASLPSEYLKDPLNPDQLLPLRPDVPSVDHWMSIDPTECADSAAIIPAIRKHAPSADIRFLGGCIYALALDDIINNFRNERDVPLLKSAMLVDRLMSRCGMNHYFTCVINRADFA